MRKLNMWAVSEKLRRPADPILLLGLLIISHCYILNVYPYFVNPNVASRVYLAQSIVDSRNFQIDSWLTRYSSIQDKALYAGHYYSDKAPGTAFWMVPWAWILRHIGIGAENTRAMIVALRWLALSIPASIFWVMLLPFFKELTKSEAGAAALVLTGSLGTNFFICATQFFSHAPAAIWLFGSYLCLRRIKPSMTMRGQLKWAGFAGFLSSLSFITDYLVCLAIPVLFVYGMLRGRYDWRRGIVFGLATIPLLGLWAWYNNTCFGSPLHLGSFYVDDESCRTLYAGGWFGMHPPAISSILGMTFGSARGMFFISPVLVTVFPGWLQLWQDKNHRSDAIVSISVCAAVFLFAMTTVDWTGGWGVGSRYLVPALPFCMMGVAGFLRLLRKGPYYGVLFMSLAIASFSEIAVSALTFPLFPSQYVNPMFNFALPLLAEGHLTANLGSGLLGSWSAVPFVVVFILATYVLWRNVSQLAGNVSWSRLFLSFGIASMILAGESLIPEPIDRVVGQKKMMAAIEWDMGYGFTAEAGSTTSR